eukprot:1674724-Pyramimonas_sp.AAC.1
MIIAPGHPLATPCTPPPDRITGEGRGGAGGDAAAAGAFGPPPWGGRDPRGDRGPPVGGAGAAGVHAELLPHKSEEHSKGGAGTSGPVPRTSALQVRPSVRLARQTHARPMPDPCQTH